MGDALSRSTSSVGCYVHGLEERRPSGRADLLTILSFFRRHLVVLSFFLSRFRLLAMNYVEELGEDDVFRVSEEWGDGFLSRRKQYTSWLCPPIEIRSRNPDVSIPPSSQNNTTSHVLSTSSTISSSVAPSSSSSCATMTCAASRVIRVGYIGPDFFTHSVSYFIHTPLMYHDASRFHVTVYANVVREDAKTQVRYNNEKEGKSSRRQTCVWLKREVDFLVG